ncbi:retrotransposon protein, putative, ty1-copia subclass [Tanacetum coccineum]
MVRSMMSLTTLPLFFWDYALDSAAHILNMVPTKKVDKTPYELWHGKVPNLSYIKVWGCEAHVKRHTPDKLQYEHPIEEESLALIVSQDEDVVPVRRSHSLGDLNEPANYKAALSDPEFEKCLVAMNEEIQSMNDNKVWKLVVLPPNAKVGFTQTYGVDYEETFSPVADIREEEIYMEQPEGFIDPNHPASRSWNKRFDEEIKKFGFHQNLDEPCVYQEASGSNVIFLILC